MSIGVFFRGEFMQQVLLQAASVITSRKFIWHYYFRLFIKKVTYLNQKRRRCIVANDCLCDASCRHYCQFI